MMGRLNPDQGHLFYSFNLEDAVPKDHQVREIAAVLDLSWLHGELAPHYSNTGRLSIDPALIIRMLILGYAFAIRSERALCREVQVNLACRWFCGLGLEDKVPDHSTFTRAGNERFRDGDILRQVFERDDGTFSRSDFTFDPDRNVYVCPAGQLPTTTGRVNYDDTYRCLASIAACRNCPLKDQCCPNSPKKKITRSIHEAARDVARDIATTDAYEQTRRDRKKVEMLFAHLKRILRLGRLRLRGPSGAQDELTLAAIAQNLRRLAKFIVKPPDAATLFVA
jgi:transposase